MRILFITSSRIGDAVISSLVLERLRVETPGARITVACGAAAAPVFARLPGLERLIIFEKQRFDAHWFRLWGKLIGTVWDIAVDVRGSGILLFLVVLRRRILRGGRRPGRRYEQLAVSMGWAEAPLPVVWTAPADDQRAHEVMGDGPVLALAPTANWSGKIWPAARFVAVAQALMAKIPGLKVAVFAGPGEAERALAAPVLDALPGAIDLVGALELSEAAACFRRSKLFIGNDSGLMHIAAAAGAPTLGLFGRSRASEYAPAGVCTAVAVAPGPEGEAPMEGLTEAAVLAAAEALLCV